MKNLISLTISCITTVVCGQSVVQTINSGGFASGLNASVGEIIIEPQSQTQSNSGLLGIFLQLQQQTLGIATMQIDNEISIYPNPTNAILNFKCFNNLTGEKLFIFDNLGRKINEKILNADNTLDFSNYSAGVYFIQFADKQKKPLKIIKN